MREHQDLDYLQSVARVRALENQMVKASDFRKMAEARSPEEAYKVLADHPICRGYEMKDSEAAFAHCLEEAYNTIESIAPERSVAEIFRCRYDGHNLKTAIKACKLGRNFDEVFTELGNIPVKTVKSQVASNSYQAYTPELASAAQEAMDSFLKTGNPQVVDILIDKATFAEMTRIAGEIGNSGIKRYVASQIDLANLRTAVRVKRMNADAAYLAEVLIDGGTVWTERIREAYARGGWDSLTEVFAASDYAAALEASIAAIRDGGELTDFERRCEDASTDTLFHTKTQSSGPEPLAAYLVSKELEVKAARVVMASKLAGASEDEIYRRLRATFV